MHKGFCPLFLLFALSFAAVSQPSLSDTVKLKEVTISSPKTKYSTKNNPGFDLIEQVIHNKKRNRQDNFQFYRADKYEKLDLSFSHVKQSFKKRREFRHFRFIFQNEDTTKLKGETVIPFYINEKAGRVEYRKSGRGLKELILAKKKSDIKGIFNTIGLENILDYFNTGINIYDDNIMLLSKTVVSPLSTSAKFFYKFYLVDSALENNKDYFHLAFEPKNTTDLLFRGSLYISRDGSFAVKRAELSFTGNTNIDWVKSLSITQIFDTIHTSDYYLSKEENSIDCKFREGQTGILAQHLISYSNFRTDTAGGIQKGRQEELSETEKKIYTTIDSLNKNPGFHRFQKLLVLSTTLHYNLGKLEIGPVNTLYSYNPVEGSRIRFGGRTTPEFNKKLFLEGYLAYGFLDQHYKYGLSSVYSLSGKGFNVFPVSALKLNYWHDVHEPGQDQILGEQDNILFSFRRIPSYNWLFSDLCNLEYLNEFSNNFSCSLSLKNWKQSPLGNLQFIENNYSSSSTNQIVTSEVNVMFKWAPGQQFYESRFSRISLPNQYPVFSLQVSRGIKGLFGAEYDYSRITFAVKKRFFLSEIGSSDISLESGKIFGRVPFPLLYLYPANPTYYYTQGSYNMMNSMEFMSDQYISLFMDHSFNGFFLNKLPLIRKTKIREVISMKILYGGLSSMNDPSRNPGLLKFPGTDIGQIPSYNLSGKPYMEGSLGLANIFNILRIELVKRFTYTDHPGVATLGLRFRLDVNF